MTHCWGDYVLTETKIFVEDFFAHTCSNPRSVLVQRFMSTLTEQSEGGKVVSVSDVL